MQQYMISSKQINNEHIELEDSVWHHIKNVMRQSNLAKIICVDYQTQRRYLCQIINDKVKIIEELEANNELPHPLVLAFGLVKSDKFELVIQKACELGATTLIPLMMERSIVKVDAKKLKNKMQRWHKIALEACEQAKRNTIMEIVEPIKMNDLINYKQVNNYVAYENEELTNNLRDKKELDASTMIVIGPEGGISDTEYNYLKDNGFNSVSLGKRILRCETAAITSLSILGYLMEDFNENIRND